jgi:hypothetical protein
MPQGGAAMPEKESIERMLASAEDADTVRRARDMSRWEAERTLEKAQQSIRESQAAIRRADETLSRR